MKPYLLLTLLIGLLSLCSFTSLAYAQESNLQFQVIIQSLENKFGAISAKHESPYFCELSFSAAYIRLDELFESLNKSDVTLKRLALFARDKEMAAIIISLEQENSAKPISSHKIKAFTEFCNNPNIPWSNELPHNDVFVTSIETSFQDGVTIIGQTDKSNLIFANLFPILNKVRGISTPFFERGRYFETNKGRKMEFTLQCKWSNQN